MRLGKGTVASMAIITVALGFVLTAISGWTERDYKRVMHVSYNTTPNTERMENLYWDKETGLGVNGELGVNMSGKVHDGYLELHIRREQGEETRIIPLNHVYNLVFFEPK